MIDLATNIGKLILVLGAWLLLALIFALPVKWLTNWVLTPATLVLLFGGPLTVWKAWGLSSLCSLLFGFKSSESSK